MKAHLFFSYCSIGLLINALLLFLIVAKLKFKSHIINLLGGASLTICMLHGANLILWGLLAPVVNHFLLNHYDATFVGECVLITKTFAIAIFVILVSTAIHYCLIPVASKAGDMVQYKFKYCVK